MIKPNLDLSAKTVLVVITTLIYSVRPVGNMCEEVIRLIAEANTKKFPEVASLLLKKRYVKDLGDSSTCDAKRDKLITDSTKVLGSIQMNTKGWARSSINPPKELSVDRISQASQV